MGKTARMLGISAVLLVAVGAVVVATAPSNSFGWFAYAPFIHNVYRPAGSWLSLVLNGRQLADLVTVVTGLVLAGLAVGIRLGRRHTAE